MKSGALVLLALALVACGSSGSSQAAGLQAPAAAVSPSAGPSPVTAPSPSPAPSTAPVVQSPPLPSTEIVLVAGLRPGLYPVHLHSRCSGAQAFHVTTLQNLVVGGGGSGVLRLPTAYLGRGLCVIVYGNSRLTTVVATRPV